MFGKQFNGINWFVLKIVWYGDMNCLTFIGKLNGEENGKTKRI